MDVIVDPRKVFPTRVGVYRLRPCFRDPSLGFPHTRGGVPRRWFASTPASTFSPHAWGCTDLIRQVVGLVVVFPTRVGVYRVGRGRHRSCMSFPHTRGGVPARSLYPTRMAGFSPHAWGCTGETNMADTSAGVFPTRVGVYRRSPQRQASHLRFPHTRGGVPVLPVGGAVLPMFSPHAWGCTGGDNMSCIVPLRFPHTRGGVPRPAIQSPDE